MEVLHTILGQPFIALFVVVGLGLALGNIAIKGVSLGSSAVLFTALAAGHFGYTVPDGMGTLGLVLFVYCVGIGAGGRFFAAIARDGSKMARLGLVIVASGSLLTVLLAWAFHLPADLAAGIFAGAMTSTPALAAASEGLGQGANALVVGYGIAYPFGVIGVVCFVQILPRLMRLDWSKAGADDADPAEAAQRVETVLVETTNPNLFGKRISDSAISSFEACQVSRILRNGKLVPLSYDDTYTAGLKLLLVGRSKEIGMAIDLIGHRSDERVVKDVENERQVLFVTSKAVAGRSLRDLAPLKNHGVVVTRIHRLGVEFVPGASTVVEAHDMLTVVGPPENLAKFAEAVGHRPSGIGQTDLLSLSLGLALGILLGMVPFALPGGEPLTLGLAGGPLLAGLLLGHFGRVGRIVGHIPRPTRMLLQEFGLVLFLADAGIKGGGSMVATLQQQGLALFVMGVAITVIPLMIGYVMATKVERMSLLQALGGICGGMTSTPALGAVTSRTESQAPVVSYASAYPVALILMTVFAKLVVKLAGG